MKLRDFYKNRINRSEVNSWKFLLEDEISKNSLEYFNVSVLKGVKNYVENNEGSILFVDRPMFPTSNFSKNEKRININVWRNRIVKLLYNIQIINKNSLEKKTFNFIKNITGSPNKLRKNYMVNEDFDNSLVRVVNGYRQCSKKEPLLNCNSIYLFGSSLVYSPGCGDAETLSSLLENQLNNSKFKVINRGVPCKDAWNSCFAILDTKISKGDLVILYGLKHLSEKDKITLKKESKLLDLTETLMRPHNFGNVFYDRTHLTPEGNKVIANFIATEIKANLKKGTTIAQNSFSNKEKSIFKKVKQCRNKAALRYIDEGFPHYINILKSQYKLGNNGIAAMNCNPFTLGHKYLISTASKMVDNLYIFVVEEDKSYFKFEQRFEMVKNGVKDIANVEVVKAGKYLVSSMTFPDYFKKEEKFNPIMDVSYDFEIFTSYIAPTLKLKNRFIATEPFCKTTRTQHEIMKETLPSNGISVIEIERLENEYGPISASKVRKLIKNKDFEKLGSFLPKTTIDVLIKYGHLN